jgi:hypothetical protein
MAGGMNKRGNWGPMTERVRQAAHDPPRPAAVPTGVKHCWVTDHNGRLPGLLLGWRHVGDDFEGRVVRLVWEDKSWTVVAEWLPAHMLEKA